MNATIDVTDAQLEALRDEAGRAGDFATVYLARIALGEAGASFSDGERGHALAYDVDVYDTHPDVARRICEQAIRDAAAQNNPDGYY